MKQSLKRFSLFNFNIFFFILLILISTSISIDSKLANFLHHNHHTFNSHHPLNYRKFLQDITPSKDFQIADYQMNYYIDSKKENACDIKVKEIITYNSTKKLGRVVHTILSKKLPYEDFKIRVLTPGVKINESKVVKTAIVKKHFINQNDSVNFRDRWIISIEFTEKVQNVTVEYEYDIQRAVMIDPVNDNDLIRISVINPFSLKLDNLKLNVFIDNFKNLDSFRLRVPPYSNIHQINKDSIQIKTVRTLPVFGQVFIQFNLPLEITVCDPKMVKLVYYGMIAMTASFVIISIIAFAYIYKE